MLPFTSLLIALFALLMVILGMLVSLRRFKLQTVFGDGNDDMLRRRIRAHGNFTEYAPLAILIVGILEFRGTVNILVGGLALAFLLSRLLHAYGMLYGQSPTMRGIGMMIQSAAFVVGGGFLVLEMLGILQ